MNSVDRATLIDFALGRLDDAEAAELVRRAERDSEFAQTLDALRQELATLDYVRPSALSFLFSRRAPQLLLGPPVSSPLDLESRSPLTSEAPQDGATLTGDEAKDELVVLFNAAPANVVKVRRIGPVYPYYSDDETPVAESCALQAVFSPSCAEHSQSGENEQSCEDSLNSENAQDCEDGLNSENEQSCEDALNKKNAQDCEDGLNSENEQGCKDSLNSENAQDCEDGLNSENEQGCEDSLNSENAQDCEDGLNSENEQSCEDSLNSENAPVGRTTPPRLSRRFHFIPKFIATSRDAQPSPFIVKRARLNADVSEFARPLDERQNASAENNETLVYRDFFQPNVDEFNAFVPSSIDANLETTPLATRLDDETRQEMVEKSGEKEETNADARPTIDANLEATPLATRLDDETRQETVDESDEKEETNAEFSNAVDQTLSFAERRLAELLGREPSKAELDEYYWEPVAETSQVEYNERKRASLFDAASRWATAPAIAVGRATLALCGVGRRSALGSDAFAATKPRRRQPGKVSDMMISIVSGVLIAVVVVFPLMRLAVKEVFTTIAASAVRKIGVNVAISETAPQSDLLPFISEQLVFPRYESTELQPSDNATLQETGTRLETLAPVDSAPDPAATPPTLEVVPVDDDKSSDDLGNFSQ